MSTHVEKTSFSPWPPYPRLHRLLLCGIPLPALSRFLHAAVELGHLQQLRRIGGIQQVGRRRGDLAQHPHHTLVRTMETQERLCRLVWIFVCGTR